MTETAEVSFVVPSYRSRSTIGETLRSVLAQETGTNFEVVVVDSSDDGTADWVAERFPSVRLYRSPTRLLPGAARNRGVKEASGRWLAFIDSDAAPESNWLETLRSRLENPELLVAGGWVGNANPETVASRVLHWIEFSEVVPGTGSGHRAALSSSNWLLSRETFETVGGFAERAAMAEDLLFCQRLEGGVFFEASTGVWHHHRDRWEDVGRHLFQLGLWSGRYRRRFRASGSWLKRAPWLCFGLAPARAAKIVARILRADPGEGLRCVALLPWLLRGLQRWSSGFRTGIAEEDVQDGGR